MTRLFWKIFFSFWLAMVLIVGAFGWVHQLVDRNLGALPLAEQRQMLLRVKAEKAAEILQSGGRRGGMEGVRRWLKRQNFRDFSTVFIFNATGQELLGRRVHRSLEKLLDLGTPPNRVESDGFHALTSSDSRGRHYRIIAVAPRRAAPGSPFSREGWWIRLAIAVLVSTLVCYLLARYLTRPIRRLSWAAREMAEGNLAARVSAVESYPADELGQMGAEFDRMAAGLQRAHGLQRQLLLDVSHELRSPLARLQVATELARKRAGQTAGAELDRIELEAEKLNDLIGEILHLSRQQDNDRPLTLEPVNLTELLLSLTASARIEADRKGCRIESDIRPDLCVHANPALLERAVENVLRNALAHTPVDSTVTLEAGRAENQFVITIADQGPGVPEGELETIFRPFYRVGEARDRESGGFGLGLAIASAGIQRHGGRISARNRATGGLEVSISIPPGDPARVSGVT